MGSRRYQWLAGLDMYRKVPGELMEGTKEGNVISWLVLSVIGALLWTETREFFTSRLVADLALDSQRQQSSDKLIVKFNLTMMDLRCDYATVNVVSVLGNQQNITKHVQRWNLDAEGVQREFAHRNPDQHDIVFSDPSVTDTIEALHENGEDAVSLTPESLEYALEDFDFVFVDFFATWCSHCRDLAPTWERFAEVMHDAEAAATANKADYSEDAYEQAKRLKSPVLVAKIDCVEYDDLCREHEIMGYPTLRLFVNGDLEQGGDYHGDRTIVGFLQAISATEDRILGNEAGQASVQQHTDAAMKKHLNMTRDHEDWLSAMERSRHHHKVMWDTSAHPGCLLAGTLHLNRVPSRFYVQAQGTGLHLDPHMANLSHEINHLSFESLAEQDRSRDVVLPDNFADLLHPLDGNVYVTHELHQAYHHYIKLISTNSHYYQVVQNSQLAFYPSDQVPETKFVLDISPIAVHYRQVSRPWYDYVTSVLAIVGGTFTVVGMLDALFYNAYRRRKRSQIIAQARKAAP